MEDSSGKFPFLSIFGICFINKFSSAVELTFNPTTVKWIKMNRDQIGFYRVNYDNIMWSRLGAAAQVFEFKPFHLFAE
jgi:hypothetical protein